MTPPPVPAEELSRDEKVRNLMFNFTVIMMSMLEGAFTAMAAGMTEAMSQVGDAMADALGGEEASRKKKTGPSHAEARAEVEAKVKGMFSDLRKQVATDFPKDSTAFQAFISDPVFDDGIKIVESHHLTVPNLTEHLSDKDFANYLSLMQSEDPELGKLFHELGDWQKATPHFRE